MRPAAEAAAEAQGKRLLARAVLRRQMAALYGDREQSDTLLNLD
jgi:hypothetical protein